MINQIHTDEARLAVSAKGNAFTEGQTVFVRVLRALPGNTYLVSLGGSRFLAESRLAFSPGDSFTGTIHLRGNKVALAALETSAQGNSPQGFESLGLPADGLSLALLRFLQRYGFRFDQEKAGKGRRLAKLFPGREEEALEASLYMLEKGIDPDQRILSSFLALHGDSESAPENPGQGKSSGNENPAEESLLSLYGPESGAGGEPGILTLCNQIVSSERHWITLPFEAGLRVKGVIRLLVNLGQKHTELAEVRAKAGEKTWCFSVRCFGGKPKEALFFCPGHAEPPPGAEAVLQEIFDGTGLPVFRYSPDAMPSGLFTGNEALKTVFTEA
jgi:hypothetical protein